MALLWHAVMAELKVMALCTLPHLAHPDHGQGHLYMSHLYFCELAVGRSTVTMGFL